MLLNCTFRTILSHIEALLLKMDNKGERMDEQLHQKKLDRYVNVAKAVEGLFNPHVEIVIHDAIDHQIYAIFNNLSNRNVADPSNYNLHEHPDNSQSISNTYLKQNWNGHKMKSISTKLLDDEKHLIGIMSFHFDISTFDEFQQVINSIVSFTSHAKSENSQDPSDHKNEELQDFLTKNYNFDTKYIDQFKELMNKVSDNKDKSKKAVTENKDILFNDDWEARISGYIEQYIKKNHDSTTAVLSKDEKKDIIEHLYLDGAFKGKNAAAFVARILSISRATVYRYLSEKGYKH